MSKKKMNKEAPYVEKIMQNMLKNSWWTARISIG